MDLRKLSPIQLQQLIDKATRRREELTSRRVDKVRKRIDAILKREGLTLHEVYGVRATAGIKAGRGGRRGTGPRQAASGERASPSRGQSVPPKYRNPDDPQQTWAGRGLKPRWMVDALAAGRRIEDFLIR